VGALAYGGSLLLVAPKQSREVWELARLALPQRKNREQLVGR
jgi:hypothetical protein